MIEIVFDNEDVSGIMKQLEELGIEARDYNKSSKKFQIKRRANKIINSYAVTKLPFVLISTDDKEVAAVYSEEGDITLDRILNKYYEYHKS